MTWIKVDNGLPTHPKILEVGPRAAWFYVCALCYADRHRTGGVLTADALRSICVDPRTRMRCISLLISSHLLEVRPENSSRSPGEIQIHDFKVWQYPRPENPAGSRDISPNGETDLEHLRVRAGAGGRAGARAQGRQDKTRQLPPSPLKGGTDPPRIPEGNRKRDLERYAAQVDAYAAEHFGDWPADRAHRAVHQAIKWGKARTLEEVRVFLEDWT